jgi:CRISPR-associated protein Cmr2
MNPKYLFALTLGPVQSFIAEARRTRDLFVGSSVLSELTRAALKSCAADPYRAKLVYPHDSELSSIPNKFVVKLEGCDPRQVGKAASQAIHQALLDYWTQVPFRDELIEKQVKEQLEAQLEIYWASVAYQGDESYLTAYEQVMQLLASRKRTRDFTQLAQPGVKDSISGMRSALSPVGVKVKDYWKSKSEDTRYKNCLKEGEQLDALGCIKRFTSSDKSFPSVSSIAATSFIEKAQDLPEYTEYRRCLASAYKIKPWRSFANDWPFDGDLMFDETLVAERYKDLNKEARSKLARLIDAAKQRPCPYYAIVMMDGDQMGKHVTTCAGEPEHRELSDRLAQFSKQVKSIVMSHWGSLVYAGGDDVLALFPLEKAVVGACALASAYRNTFKDWVPQDHDTGKEFPFTASVGVAIAHHLFPLDGVLETARAAEKTAKSRYGRDAISITVLKRSGEIVTFGSSLTPVDDGWDIDGGFMRLVDDYRSGVLASKFAYEMLGGLKELVAPGKPNSVIDLEIVSALLRLSLKRHTAQEKTPSVTDSSLCRWIECFRGDSAVAPAMELANWLVFARFVASGGEE